jgi:hypothetical protein
MLNPSFSCSLLDTLTYNTAWIGCGPMPPFFDRIEVNNLAGITIPESASVPPVFL